MHPPEPVPLSSIHTISQLSDLIGSHSPVLEELEEVCVRLRIKTEDLKPKPLSHFYEDGVSPEVQDLRFNHYEKKRLYRLSQVLSEVSESAVSKVPLRHSTRNRSQDVRRLFREVSFGGNKLRYGAHSVSPSGDFGDHTPLPHDLSELSSTDVSVHDKQRTVHERRIQAQQRALHLRVSELEDKITKLHEKETRFEQTREELKAAEAEKQRKRELRSLKIRENLAKKYRNREMFETREARRGLQRTPDLRMSANRPGFVPTVSRRCLKDGSEADEAERQMVYIQTKLEESAERVHQLKHLKTLSLAAKIDQYRKAKAKVQAEEASQAQERLQLAIKLKQQFDHSKQLRTERLDELTKKRAKTNRHKLANKTWTKETSQKGTVFSDEESPPKANRPSLDPLKAEKAILKRKDVLENRSRELSSLQELKESILWKHRTLADSIERRSMERSLLSQSLMREDVQRQVRREQLLKSVEGKLKDLHSRYFRTIEG